MSLYLVDWGNRLGTIFALGPHAEAFSKNRTHRIITFEQAEYELHRASRRWRAAD